MRRSLNSRSRASIEWDMRAVTVEFVGTPLGPVWDKFCVHDEYKRWEREVTAVIKDGR